MEAVYNRKPLNREEMSVIKIVIIIIIIIFYQYTRSEQKVRALAL